MAIDIGMSARAYPKKDKILGDNNQFIEPCDFSAVITKNGGVEENIAFDFSIVDPFGKSFRNLDFAQIVNKRETEKNNKYAAYCTRERIKFSPIIFSAFGMASGNAVSKIKDLLKERPDVGSLVLQKINLVILKYGGRAVMKYYGFGNRQERPIHNSNRR